MTLVLVAFVCIGNICRSPMAEAFAVEHHAAPGVAFTSAGTATLGGRAVTPSTIRVMSEAGINIADHISRNLGDVIARNPDRIYVMTQAQHNTVVGAYPDLAHNVAMLSPAGNDIADPYGEDLATYVAVCETIANAVAARATEWSG